jgi:hypothetical protein
MKNPDFQRYKRAPSKEFCLALRNELAFISECCERGSGSDSNLFDVQFRRSNELAIYVGGTRIVICKYSKRFPRTVSFPKVASSYIGVSPDLWRQWNLDDASDMKLLNKIFCDHLMHCIDKVDDSFYGNGKEGWWENKLSIDLCRHWTRKDDFLVIDREVCIEFLDSTEKNTIMQGLVKPYREIIAEFQGSDSKRWGVPKEKPLGNEIDMIAVDRSGNLFCIELKHGSDGSKISWGAVQVGIYGDLANKYQSDLRQGANELLEGKISAGCIADEGGAHERLERLRSNTGTVETILAIAQPNPNSECWLRASEVMSAVGKSTPLAFVGEWKSDKPLASKANPELLSIGKVLSSFSQCKAYK